MLNYFYKDMMNICRCLPSYGRNHVTLILDHIDQSVPSRADGVLKYCVFRHKVTVFAIFSLLMQVHIVCIDRLF